MRKQYWSSFGSVLLATKPNILQYMLILCVWWASAGIVYYKFLDSRETITADIYLSYLQQILVGILQNQTALVKRRNFFMIIPAVVQQMQAERARNT